MSFQFTHAWWLWALPVAFGWVLWLFWHSDVQLSPVRRWLALTVRLVVVALVALAIAGLQWRKPMEGMNVYYLLDRSDSVPMTQQDAARQYLNQTAKQKPLTDTAGLIVFGRNVGIEASLNRALEVQKIQAIVQTDRTDLAAAIRLGTAAFPETGQKRLVLLSDGNENLGDAMGALLAARPLGVTLDVVPLGLQRSGDVSIQKLSLPNQLKKGQTFEVKIFAQADAAQTGTVRLFRNEQLLGEQAIELAAGKNLYTFPQTLNEPGFYSYDVQLEAPGDPVPQNNRAASFVNVRGDPRILVVSSDPKADASLVAALQTSRLEVKLVGVTGLPATVTEMQSYDAIFLSNVAAGDLGRDAMQLLESAVRDFGVGLVCVGGDQTYAAGGYRGTPLEAALPLDSDLSSKKVMPKGALVLVVHATEFPNGNQWARDIAFAALDALGAQDEMGIVLWNGNDQWLYPLATVGDKKEMGRKIMGMNPGDMMAFQKVMEMGHEALKKSGANLKHMVVFSDGDPKAPTDALLSAMLGDKITVSAVMIGGHVQPTTMVRIAEKGNGRFYDVNSPGQLPQIFIKEASVILKAAIVEEAFRPQAVAASEMLRGIAPGDCPPLLGYVSTEPKPRAEVSLVTPRGDPLLAQWQYGLGRAVAFTSDAKAKWARDWLEWDRYRQFWSQVAQWSLRRLKNEEFTTEVSVDKGEGVVSLEAVDAQGNYQNFLTLKTVVVSPKGDRQTVWLRQTGPGHYEGRFATREVGTYALNVLDLQDGQVRGSQVVGTTVSYSPEFNATEPNLNLLRRLAESGGGQVLQPRNPAENPFRHHRQKTFQPRDLWEWLLKLAVCLFTLDVAIRRIQLDQAEWLKATQTLRRWLFFWRGAPRPVEADVSLAALLARREQVRSGTTAPGAPAVSPKPELFQPSSVAPIALPTDIATAPPPPPPAPEPSTPATSPTEPQNTTSRLLEAKRRARKKP